MKKLLMVLFVAFLGLNAIAQTDRNTTLEISPAALPAGAIGYMEFCCYHSNNGVNLNHYIWQYPRNTLTFLPDAFPIGPYGPSKITGFGATATVHYRCGYYRCNFNFPNIHPGGAQYQITPSIGTAPGTWVWHPTACHTEPAQD